VPTGDEISSQLFDWNSDKLNSLPATEQAVLIAAWDKVKKSGKTIAIEGREDFDLVLERGGWKISLDWPSRTRVVFKARPSRIGYLEVKFLRNDLLVKIDDPFQIDFTVKNLTDRDLTIRVNHRFDPQWLAQNIDMIACGSLVPFRLAAREKLSISSNYLLRQSLPKTRPLAIIYDFTARQTAANENKIF
jgi:hypothetical protein